MTLFQCHVPAGLPPYLLCHALDHNYFLFLFLLENIENSHLQRSQKKTILMGIHTIYILAEIYRIKYLKPLKPTKMGFSWVKAD